MLRKLRKRLFRAKTLQERYPEYRIGRTSYGTPKVLRWGEGATLEIGEYCSIAAGVKIFLGGNHRLDWVTTYPFTVFKPGIIASDIHISHSTVTETAHKPFRGVS